MPLRKQQRNNLLKLPVLLVCVLSVGCNSSPPEERRTQEGPPDATVAPSPASGEGMQPPPLTEGDTPNAPDADGPAGDGRPRPSEPALKPAGPAPTTPGLTPTTVTPGGGSCPDPRYCSHYNTSGSKPWQRDAAGRVTIRYRINPDGAAASALTREQIVTAIRASTQVWSAANPQVQFLYEGTTSEQPANFNNVVGFSPNCGVGYACVMNGQGPNYYFGPHTDRFTMAFHNGTPWTWDPCDPSGGEPCSPDPEGDEDIANVAVHEWGHVLGLGHVNGPEDHELTMHETDSRAGVLGALRNSVTLGLGEVQGVRSLYPTTAPMPVLYRP